MTTERLLPFTLSERGAMRVKYDRETDILMVETAEGTIAHAEEMGNIIVHLTEEGKPVLLEILDASEFLTQAAKAALTAKEAEFVELTV
jgi:uncharacterized protein YuzE